MGCSNSYEPKVQTSKNSVPSYYNPIGDYTVKSQKLSPKKYYIFFKTPDPELFKLKKGFWMISKTSKKNTMIMEDIKGK